MTTPPASLPTRALTAVAFLGAAMLAGCGGPAYGPASPGVAAVVDMTPEFTFRPGAASVAVGDTVEWRNKTLIPHTVTNDPAKAKNPADVALPAGAIPFDSGRIAGGQVFRHTFTAAGTYRYVCLPHDDEGMVGTVTVRPR